MIKTLLVMLLAAGAAHAQQALNGAEFDALSRDTTMYFTNNGQFFGAEQFLPDQRSIWRAQDGTCVNGKWREVAGNICFLYDNNDGPFCWSITTSDAGITVTSTSGPDPLVLELSGQDTQPILCTGPAFGV